MRVHAIVTDLAEAEAALAAGATVLQLRLKGATTAQRVRAAANLRHLPATLVINDDVEAAIAVAADGVHLGQSDQGQERARANSLLLGISVADPDQARAAERGGAAYLGAGPVWATPSKLDAGPVIGLGGLAGICAAVALPVVAIGGVDAGNAGLCIAAGAVGVAVVRAAGDPRVRRAVDSAVEGHTEVPWSMSSAVADSTVGPSA